MKTKIKNGISYEKNGWVYLSVRGNPMERGYAMGYLCAKEFKEIQKMLSFFILESYGETWADMIRKVNEDIKSIVESEFPELYEEMQGISDGCNAGGTETTIDEIIAWNYYMSIPYWYPYVPGTSNLKLSEAKNNKEGGGKGSITDNTDIYTNFNKEGSKDRCSAFIAVGKDWTEDGEIVISHNSFCDFIDGQWSHVILDIHPDKGHRIMMQTSPCWIWSGTDFFVTSKGIVGTETTIGGFTRFAMKAPICCRIRMAMQYGNNMDEYVNILLKNNSGDYANSWLFGDINTKEIMRFELGLNYHSVVRSSNGYFIGFNAAYDSRIRTLECTNSGFYDVRRHQGARKVRLEELMEQYKGKLNVETAKLIIADHYDVYLKKDNNPCSRTVCSHYYLDAREYMSQQGRPVAYAPHGAVDGMVADTKLIKNMSFFSRWGNSCGMPFDKDDFKKNHAQWGNICDYLYSRPGYDWTFFSITKSFKSKPLLTKKNKKSNSKTKKNMGTETNTNTNTNTVTNTETNSKKSTDASNH
jgi:hypothetical protein